MDNMQNFSKDLTIIIPFLNEGIEVYNTVRNIRETSDIDIDIILINDASTDNYDYLSVAEQFATKYIEHSERKGVAASRDEGIEMSTTPYFLLMDAHMRFFQKDWGSYLVSQLKISNKKLFCFQTVSIKTEGNGNVVKQSDINKSLRGGYIVFDGSFPMSVKWNNYDPEPDKNIVDIACVYGASYSCSKKYWQYLNGLYGLRMFGSDEELISTKVWLDNGSCKLLKKVTAGHIFRDEMPYATLDVDFFYNKLYIAELFLPKDLKYKIFTSIDKIDTVAYKKAVRILSFNNQNIKQQKKYYKEIFSNEISYVIEMNKFLEDRNL